MGCRGFHSSVRGTQSGLSLNIGMYSSSTSTMEPDCLLSILHLIFHAHVSFFLFFSSKSADVSTTMIVRPGPVSDFLLANQKVDHPSKIDWQKVSHVFVWNLLNDHTNALKYLFDNSILDACILNIGQACSEELEN